MSQIDFSMGPMTMNADPTMSVPLKIQLDSASCNTPVGIRARLGRDGLALAGFAGVPDGADTQPAYSPALVAFLPATGADQIGWVPLR